MSVINKMLRDLDSRQPGETLNALRSPGAQAGLTAGTAAVGARGVTAGKSANQPGWVWRAGLLLVAVLAAVLWWASQSSTPSSVLATPPVAAVRLPEPAVGQIDGDRVQPQVAAQPASPPASIASVSAPAAVPAPASRAVAEPRAVQPGVTVAPQVPVKAAAVSVNVAKAAGASAPAAPPEPLKPRLPAATEVLAQAQERWNLGEPSAALGLLQSAVSRLEPAGASEATALAALTREYVRMTLSQGQLTAAWSMLTRLELPLAGVADIWALRGNVAQRLGRHPEAVQAYLKALELRPNEPRWMLGAAVSLAQQGQTGPAGELAEMARQAGALRPDVANYLRQLGVVLRAD